MISNNIQIIGTIINKLTSVSIANLTLGCLELGKRKAILPHHANWKMKNYQHIVYDKMVRSHQSSFS